MKPVRTPCEADAKGNLYGTTYWGGSFYYGVLFKLSRKGIETVLWNFCQTGYPCPTDGADPSAGVTFDAEGNLYGTTSMGGDLGCWSGSGCGVVFKLSKSGKETVLHTFTGGADGWAPYAGLIFDAKGNLYGTTRYGDTGSCNDGYGVGCGVVFKVNPKTKHETVLYTFTGGRTARSPKQV